MQRLYSCKSVSVITLTGDLKALLIVYISNCGWSLFKISLPRICDPHVCQTQNAPWAVFRCQKLDRCFLLLEGNAVCTPAPLLSCPNDPCPLLALSLPSVQRLPSWKVCLRLSAFMSVLRLEGSNALFRPFTILPRIYTNYSCFPNPSARGAPHFLNSFSACSVSALRTVGLTRSAHVSSYSLLKMRSSEGEAATYVKNVLSESDCV